MAHAVGGHPIHWHVDPNIKQEIEFYNARRRKNQAGWGARDTLAGEGFKVSGLIPVSRESSCGRRQARPLAPVHLQTVD